MKQTLSVYEIADALKKDQYASWSYKGSKALAEYLDQLDQDSGEDTELDIVEIRCDWSEYASAQEACHQYDWSPDFSISEELNEEDALDYLRDRTEVIRFKGGIIIKDF